MSKEIIVTVDPIGGVEVATKGFSGKSCTDATKELEEALGKVTSDKKTGDYYKAEVKAGQKARS